MSTKETTAGHDVKPTARPWVHHSGSVWASKPVIDGFASVPIAKMDREYGNGTTPCERDANAALIVRAVNAHDDLVGALAEVESRMEIWRETGVAAGRFDRLQAVVRAALAKAEGREAAV